jgi:hypothetical protein
MRGEHEPGTGQWPGDTSGKVRIPGVAVHNIGGIHGTHHGEIATQRIEQPGVAAILSREPCRCPDPVHPKISMHLVLFTEGENIHLVS